MTQRRPAKSPGRDECADMYRLCLSTNLRRTERLVTRHYDAHLAPAGVTAVQFPMLAIIGSAEEATVRLIASQLDLDRSTLSRNLALLASRGLVVMGPPAGPKPATLSLTAKGRQTLRRAYGLWLDAHAALEAALSKDAVSGGLEFLKTLRHGARELPAARASSKR